MHCYKSLVLWLIMLLDHVHAVFVEHLVDRWNVYADQSIPNAFKTRKERSY